MKNHLPFLLAFDWQELISFAVGAVFLVVWVVNQIKAANKKMAGGQPPAQPARPRPAPMANAPPQADPLRAQIDEFLRRAAQQAQPDKGQAAQAAPRQPVRDEVVVLLDEAPPEPRRQSRVPTLQPAASAQPPRRQAPGKKPKSPRPKSVSEHVAERIGSASQQMREEVAHLGERVIEADKQFDVQLHQKFDHQLGSLSERTTASAYDQPTSVALSPAAQIAAMLSNPDGVRQAIILNEILRRPDEQW